jgi:hypothetical protein
LSGSPAKTIPTPAERKIAAASPPFVAHRVLELIIAIFGIKSCHRIGLIYTGQVRLNWNLPRLAILAFLTLFGAGCGGISASKSISPASFFLPGLMRADPPAATNAPVAISAPFQQLAQAR